MHLRRQWALAAMMISIAGCTAQPSGPEHWHRACEHAATLDTQGAFAIEVCARSLGESPTWAADDVARCMLAATHPDPDGEVARACWRPETREHYDRVARAWEALDTMNLAVHASVKRLSTVPSTLVGIAGITETIDPWNTPYRIAPSGDLQFVLSSAGADRQFDTADDLTVAQDFLYFQF